MRERLNRFETFTDHIHRHNDSLAIEKKRHVVCVMRGELASERVCSIVVSTFLNAAYDVCVYCLFFGVYKLWFSCHFIRSIPFLVVCVCVHVTVSTVLYSIHFNGNYAQKFTHFCLESDVSFFCSHVCCAGLLRCVRLCVKMLKKKETKRTQQHARARHQFNFRPKSIRFLAHPDTL